MGEHTEAFFEYKQELKLVRILHNTFVPSTISIKVGLVPNPENENFSLAITKCKFWFDACLTNIVAVEAGDELAINAFSNEETDNISNNNLMITPFEPNDSHLAELFQAKITALADDAFWVTGIEMTSDNMKHLSFVMVDDDGSDLPGMTDWIGERTFFDKPWWSRNDGSFFDVVPNEDSDLSIKPEFAVSLDFLDDLEKPSSPPEGATIVRPSFKPTVIPGGKDGK